MGTATHLGPWLLGTVKDTTGTTAGTVRNLGATSVVQTVTLVAGAAVTMYLPAGALIEDAFVYMTTGAVGTPNLTVNGVIIGTISTAAGKNNLVVTAANVGTMANVGSVDALVSYTATAATAGTLVVQYVVRNSNASYAPIP